MNKIKKQIRDTTRLFKKENDDQQKVQEMNRKIAGLVHQMEQITKEQHYDKIQQRYKAVRFFELRKAKTEQDLLYILYYPLGFKYVSLYKDGADKELQAEIVEACSQLGLTVKQSKSLSVNYQQHEQVTRAVYESMPKLKRQLWSHIIHANERTYESLGMDTKQVLTQRLSHTQTKVQAPDQDDNFFNEEQAPIEVSKQALEFIPKKPERVKFSGK